MEAVLSSWSHGTGQRAAPTLVMASQLCWKGVACSKRCANDCHIALIQQIQQSAPLNPLYSSFSGICSYGCLQPLHSAANPHTPGDTTNNLEMYSRALYRYCMAHTYCRLL